jgi:hypothetical protein
MGFSKKSTERETADARIHILEHPEMTINEVAGTERLSEVAKEIIETKDPRAVEPLTALLAWSRNWHMILGDPLSFLFLSLYKQEVRYIAEETLLALKDSRTIQLLIPLLKNKDKDTRLRAARIIGLSKDQQAAEVVNTAIDAIIAKFQNKNESPDERALAAVILGYIQEPKATEALAIALEDNPFEVRHAAAEALVKLGDFRATNINSLICERCQKNQGSHHSFYYGKVLRVKSHQRLSTVTTIWKYELAGSKEVLICRECLERSARRHLLWTLLFGLAGVLGVWVAGSLLSAREGSNRLAVGLEAVWLMVSMIFLLGVLVNFFKMIPYFRDRDKYYHEEETGEHLAISVHRARLRNLGFDCSWTPKQFLNLEPDIYRPVESSPD